MKKKPTKKPPKKSSSTVRTPPRGQVRTRSSSPAIAKVRTRSSAAATRHDGTTCGRILKRGACDLPLHHLGSCDVLPRRGVLLGDGDGVAVAKARPPAASTYKRPTADQRRMAPRLNTTWSVATKGRARELKLKITKWGRPGTTADVIEQAIRELHERLCKGARK